MIMLGGRGRAGASLPPSLPSAAPPTGGLRDGAGMGLPEECPLLASSCLGAEGSCGQDKSRQRLADAIPLQWDGGLELLDKESDWSGQ